MFITGGTNRQTAIPQLRGTYWHCEKCGLFVSIHSAGIVYELRCPLCLSELEFCAAFDSGLERTLEDA
jgi:rubrerythrin